VAKRTQQVALNNFAICCVGMLRSFGRSLTPLEQARTVAVIVFPLCLRDKKQLSAITKVSNIFSQCIGVTWIKLNKGEVCFGAKNDSYGKFTITSDGNVITMKLVYISGFVTCNIKNVPFGSHWACRKKCTLATIVTNAKTRVIFPQNYQNRTYDLPGYYVNLTELVFNELSPPLRVAVGDEYRIWFHDDFVNKKEYNNDGHTCADVYARYTG